MLKDQINEELKTAMKAKDAALTNALRNIKTKVLELQKQAIDKDVTDQEVIQVITKLAKERRQSIEMYKQGGREDLVEAEQFELSVIEKYLPRQLDESEITEIVSGIINDNNFGTIKDMGKVMKLFNEKYAGRADGKLVSQIVKNKLG